MSSGISTLDTFLGVTNGLYFGIFDFNISINISKMDNLDKQLFTLRFKSLAGDRSWITQYDHPLSAKFLKQTKEMYEDLRERERRYILLERQAIQQLEKEVKCEQPKNKN